MESKHLRRRARGSMNSSVTSHLTGTVPRVPDRYQLKSQAGKGGMGAVYQALDSRTGSLVAIKVLQSRGAIEMARFEQEARVLSEVQHPGIVRYFDHGITPDGAPFIVMEWLEGETLEERMARGRMSPAGVARVAQFVLAALAAAHGRDIVHRDIKPGNIFLVEAMLGNVRVLDFGIARRRLDIKRLTRDGSTVGTPLYTSPEQARGRADVDGRADIFSLGCVLFEALTGEPPFTGDTPLEVMTKICAGRAPDIATRRAGLPAALASLVNAMLAHEPARRPQSAATLAGEFARLTNGSGSAEDECGAVETKPHARVGCFPAREERMSSAMLVARGTRSRHEEEILLAELRRLSDRFTCVMDRLIDHTVLVTAGAAPTAEEQVIRLASMALALREVEPSAKIAIATGRMTLLGNLPVGPLMDRFPALMDGQAIGTIRVDPATRRLLPAAFRVGGAVGPLLLVGGAGAPNPTESNDAVPEVLAAPTARPSSRRRTVSDG